MSCRSETAVCIAAASGTQCCIDGDGSSRQLMVCRARACGMVDGGLTESRACTAARRTLAVDPEYWRTRNKKVNMIIFM